MTQLSELRALQSNDPAVGPGLRTAESCECHALPGAGWSHHRRRALVLLTALLGGVALTGALGALGCEEIAAVDESRIPADRSDADPDAADGGGEGSSVGDAGAGGAEQDSEANGGAHGGEKG